MSNAAIDDAKLVFDSVAGGCFTLVIIPAIVVQTRRYIKTELEKRNESWGVAIQLFLLLVMNLMYFTNDMIQVAGMAAGEDKT